MDGLEIIIVTRIVISISISISLFYDVISSKHVGGRPTATDGKLSASVFAIRCCDFHSAFRFFYRNTMAWTRRQKMGVFPLLLYLSGREHSVLLRKRPMANKSEVYKSLNQTGTKSGNLFFFGTYFSVTRRLGARHSSPPFRETLTYNKIEISSSQISLCFQRECPSGLGFRFKQCLCQCTFPHLHRASPSWIPAIFITPAHPNWMRKNWISKFLCSTLQENQYKSNKFQQVCRWLVTIRPTEATSPHRQMKPADDASMMTAVSVPRHPSRTEPRSGDIPISKSGDRSWSSSSTECRSDALEWSLVKYTPTPTQTLHPCSVSWGFKGPWGCWEINWFPTAMHFKLSRLITFTVYLSWGI